MLCHSNCVKFFSDLFQWAENCPVMPVFARDLHKKDGLTLYNLYADNLTGCIAVQPNVATQLPNFRPDVIIQFDPPTSAEEVQTMSQLCTRYTVFLRPSEVGFVKHLRTTLKLKLQE